MNSLMFILSDLIGDILSTQKQHKTSLPFTDVQLCFPICVLYSRHFWRKISAYLFWNTFSASFDLNFFELNTESIWKRRKSSSYFIWVLWNARADDTVLRLRDSGSISVNDGPRISNLSMSRVWNKYYGKFPIKLH